MAIVDRTEQRLPVPDLDSPVGKRVSQTNFDAACIEGHVLEHEHTAHQAQGQIAAVKEFLSATRARLALWDAENAD